MRAFLRRLVIRILYCLTFERISIYLVKLPFKFFYCTMIRYPWKHKLILMKAILLYEETKALPTSFINNLSDDLSLFA